MGISFSFQEALGLYEVVAAAVFLCMQSISSLQWLSLHTALTALKAFTVFLFLRMQKCLDYYKILKQNFEDLG